MFKHKLWILSKHMYMHLGQPSFLRDIQWKHIKFLLNINDNHTIIDIGAGQMKYSFALARSSNAKIIAIDLKFSKEHILEARKHNILTIEADCNHRLPISNNSVDRIIISSLLHMLPEPSILLYECKRILKKDGYIVASIPNNYLFIPKIIASKTGRVIFHKLRIPTEYNKLISILNTKFYVYGERGYYSYNELDNLVKSANFSITEHRYSPGLIGSFFWEIAVLLHLRLGKIAFHLLLITKPIVTLFELLYSNNNGCEHLVKLIPSDFTIEKGRSND